MKKPLIQRHQQRLSSKIAEGMDKFMLFWMQEIDQLENTIEYLQKENNALKTEISSLKEKSNLPE